MQHAWALKDAVVVSDRAQQLGVTEVLYGLSPDRSGFVRFGTKTNTENIAGAINKAMTNEPYRRRRRRH